MGLRCGNAREEAWAALEVGDPVLVVEPDARRRRAIAAALGRAGFSVATAADGRFACKRMAARRPALIVLDLRLPGITAPVLAAAARAAFGASFPIVAIAEHGTATWQEQVGACSLVSGPCRATDVVGAVRAALAASGELLRSAIADGDQ